MMKLLGWIFVLLLALTGIAMSYHAWYGPVTRGVPALKQYLPAPTAEPTAAAVQLNTAPVVLSTPAPGPAVPLATRLPWSYADCTFAITTMTQDRHLDQQEAWNIAEGFDFALPTQLRGRVRAVGERLEHRAHGSHCHV